jgi:hypothetical protein
MRYDSQYRDATNGLSSVADLGVVAGRCAPSNKALRIPPTACSALRASQPADSPVKGKRDGQIILLSVPTALHVDFDPNSLYISF